MQELALQLKRFFFDAVGFIPYDAVSNIGHTDANLVRAPGLQFACHQRIPPKPLLHLNLRDCLARMLRRHTHFLAVGRVAPDRIVERERILFDVAVDKRSVLA